MKKRLVGSRILVMALVALMMVTSLAQVAMATENINTEANSENIGRSEKANQIRSKRLKGDTRFETAIAISKEAYDKSDTVILASSNGEADALTGTILAADKKAPLLLIQKDRVPASVEKEIQRLDAKEIYILGGTGAVAEAVKDSLSENYKVTRISGDNREETAIKIADQVEGKTNEYFLALGYGDLADALAIGPVSGIKKTPILLTQKNKIPTTTLEHIKETKPSKVTIVGGTTAIGKEIENQIPEEIEIDRVSGSNRIDTSAQIAKKYYTAKESDNKVILANGISIADALVGGHLAAKTETPIILTSSNRTNQTANKYIADLKADLLVLGGDKAINESTVKKMIKEINDINNPNYDNNQRIENKTQLRDYIFKGIENEQEYITVDYYGKDLKDWLDVGKFIDSIMDERIATRSYLTVDNVWINDIKQDQIKIKFGPSYRKYINWDEFVLGEVDRVVKEIIKPNMSEYEKVRVLHDYIVDNTTYSDDTIGHAGSASTVFKENKGVCAGYTDAFNALLQGVGIDSYYISGMANNGNRIGSHAWSKVKVDGVWYNVDATWSFPVKKYGKHSAYKYFLVSDERLYKTHTPREPEYYPVSNDKRYDGQYDGDYSKE